MTNLQKVIDADIALTYFINRPITSENFDADVLMRLKTLSLAFDVYIEKRAVEALKPVRLVTFNVVDKMTPMLKELIDAMVNRKVIFHTGGINSY